MKNQTILILQGLPASSKTTFAKELQKKEPNRWKRTNKDELRLMVDNGLWSRDNEKLIIEIRDSIIIKSIQAGYNVIVDDTNFSPEHINNIRVMASLLESDDRHVNVEIKFFDVPLQTCLERDALRGDKSVGKKVIMEMYIKYVKKDIVLDQDVKAPRAIISDIDGCIATNQGQRGFYDWDKVYLDDENLYVTNIIRAMSKKYKIIIVSGRDGSCYDMTKKWLEDHKIPFDILLMRKKGDMRSDEIVKREIFDGFIRNKYYIESVIDDRPKVARTWRALGLKTLQCGDPDIEF